MRKILSVITVSALTVSLLAGCSSGSGENSSGNDSENVTLKLFHNWINTDEVTYFEDLAAEFEEAHPEVTIEIENISDPDYKTKLSAMMGSEDAPDIFYSWSGEFAYNLVRNDSVLDLTSYYDEDQEWADSFVHAALPPFTYEDEIYGVPIRVDCKMMMYNKDIFEEYGLSVPSTYDEFLDVCQTLKDNGVTPIALGTAQETWIAAHYISTFNAMCVPDDVRASDDNIATMEYSDPGYVEAIEMLQELNDKGYFTENCTGVQYDVARNDFLTGNAGMYYGQSIEFRYAEENNLNAGVFQIPTPEGAKGNPNITTGTPDGFMISKTCENPDLAVEFLKLMTSKEWQERVITQLSAPASIQGVHNEENSNELILEAVNIYSNSDGFTNWLDANMPGTVADVYLPGLQGVLGGTETPSDLMTKVHEAALEAQAE